jgi:hypothetical protein
VGIHTVGMSLAMSCHYLWIDVWAYTLWACHWPCHVITCGLMCGHTHCGHVIGHVIWFKSARMVQSRTRTWFRTLNGLAGGSAALLEGVCTGV